MSTPVLDPARLPFAYEDALNAGAVDAVVELFDTDATMRTVTGDILTTGTQLREEAVRTIAGGARLTNTERFTLVAGDTALLVVDWTMEITTPDGVRIKPTGTTTAVARRVGDRWKFAVLNPLGTA